MNGDGYACISDYGLEIVLCDDALVKPTKRNVRWAAPEVLGASRLPLGDDGKAADIYSLGVVTFEVRLGTTPVTHALTSVSPELRS